MKYVETEKTKVCKEGRNASVKGGTDLRSCCTEATYIGKAGKSMLVFVRRKDRSLCKFIHPQFTGSDRILRLGLSFRRGQI